MAEEIRYSVLAYKDECGLWLKIPEADLQISAEDFEIGLDVLEEHFDSLLERARIRGDHIPCHRVRTFRWVEKAEYGPTQVDIERERYLRELRAEEDNP